MNLPGMAGEDDSRACILAFAPCPFAEAGVWHDPYPCRYSTAFTGARATRTPSYCANSGLRGSSVHDDVKQPTTLGRQIRRKIRSVVYSHVSSLLSFFVCDGDKCLHFDF